MFENAATSNAAGSALRTVTVTLAADLTESDRLLIAAVVLGPGFNPTESSHETHGSPS